MQASVLKRQYLAESGIKHQLVLGKSVKYYHNYLSKVARQMGGGFRREDLIQAGWVGLLEAKARYKPEYGVPLTAYAAKDIRGRMLETIARVSGAVSVPIRVYRTNDTARANSRAVPLIDEVHWAHRPGTANPLFEIMDQDEELSQRLKIRSFMSQLEYRDRKIISDRWLGDHPATLETLGYELGVSSERVRQLELRVLNTMREAICE